ncbi:MAG: cob(I)yrinic acid a,c-diamide adenosyltransferase, partial [Clostridia bacterium]|nr:cob(I)yrinic acid a,c-diamide adenosyltransferase [Clostridia bacterium]
MIHIYYGDGKGKTTAACGLAVRAAGSGMKVLFAQFFKSGKSSEIGVISSLTNVTVKIPSLYYGRYKTMSDDQKKMIEDRYSAFLDDIILNADNYDLIVLDEAVSVYGYGLFER